MDENPYRLDDQSEGFLARYLANLSASESDNQTVEIRLQNFLILGQGDRGRDIFYDRLNRITPKIANGNWKAIYKTQYVDEVGMHGVKTPHRHGQLVIADTAKLKMLHYWGGRIQDWGPDTPKVIGMTVEFNDVRNTIAKSVRHSLMTFNDTAAFSKDTGPWLVHIYVITVGLLLNRHRRPDFVACEQQKHRPACASAQSDQRRCHSPSACVYVRLNWASEPMFVACAAAMNVFVFKVPHTAQVIWWHVYCLVSSDRLKKPRI